MVAGQNGAWLDRNVGDTTHTFRQRDEFASPKLTRCCQFLYRGVMPLSNFQGLKSKVIALLKHVTGLTPSGQLYELELAKAWGLFPDRSANPLTRKPLKHFSQSDEDGITLEILRRLQIEKGRFLEFGVGNGLENNTLILLAHGWYGGWIGGEELVVKLPIGGRLNYWKRWVDRESIQKLLLEIDFKQLALEAHVVSLDLDGNDAYFVSDLLENGVRPSLWIQEYNATIPVDVSWTIDYNPTHSWEKDNYFGASLKHLATLFEQHQYTPVACSATGANVFFIRNDLMHLFQDCPTSLAEIYVPPLYFLQNRWGQKVSPKFVESLLK